MVRVRQLKIRVGVRDFIFAGSPLKFVAIRKIIFGLSLPNFVAVRLLFLTGRHDSPWPFAIKFHLAVHSKQSYLV